MDLPPASSTLLLRVPLKLGLRGQWLCLLTAALCSTDPAEAGWFSSLECWLWLILGAMLEAPLGFYWHEITQPVKICFNSKREKNARHDFLWNKEIQK